eukprot:TRINITY_DN11218_c0_g1_i1.p1 TRINITY_DN11218_c0_g1~~TRINITY_DN11218_c0_g1_i1.p1  ORF type:complete len:652 (+),score=107.12 TRINITY_DN11218_c0_g1_i1:127-2082(+)
MAYTWETFFVLSLIIIMLLLLAFEVAPADFLLLGVALVSHLAGIITLKDMFVGFNNTGMLTVGVLFMVSLAIEQTGGISYVANIIFRGANRRTPMVEVLLRLFVPIAALSAFLNNTPLVAMMMQTTADFAYQVNVAPSKLLIFLSYAAILGGTVTTIGTSTNLVVTGFAERFYEKLNPPQKFDFPLFEIGKVGLPSLLAGILFVATVGHRLVPARTGSAELLKNRRVFAVIFRVIPNGKAVGKTLEKVGIKGYSIKIQQIVSEAGLVVSSPIPETQLNGGDLIYIAGTVEDFLSFAFLYGIEMVDESLKAIPLRWLGPYDKISEAILAHNSDLVNGKPLGSADFRGDFNAGPILGVHRQGEELLAPSFNELVLRPGDVILFVAGRKFKRQDNAFNAVLKVNNVKPVHRWRAPLSALIAVTMIVVAAAYDKAGMFLSSLVAAALLVLTGCFTPAEGRSSLNLEVLLTVAAAFGVSEAMTQSNAAKLVADGLLAISKWAGEGGVIACVYYSTSLITEVITNNAAVAIMFPIAWETAKKYGYNFRKFIYVLMMGGSASFITPIGYQTNMMVKDLGGYHFLDYLRVGNPLQLLVGVVSVLAAVFDDYWYLFTIGFAVADIVILPLVFFYEKKKILQVAAKEVKDPGPTTTPAVVV